ncbi:hypothetical protein Q4E93_28685 [Flavitalea sp. BT771]|uniref:hypothetical protein n=1 Tax=Flavitalea sp. BT771 TaxID=3063329 RepID=UPI0026E1D720|nr:hypothetical protein [Flavitalea sp. BT771]MDO6434622.1 hypothetical protein [Flavitalea sp. BT771]MDV6223522.1 hypothetical protein [Flavitalea sp. BT771]
MIYIKYIALLILFFLLHFFLSNTWLIAAWCLLGIVSCTWIREARHPLLNIMALELVIGAAFWTFFWSGNEGLRQIAYHSGTSPVLWPLLAIAVNVLTAFLCSTTFFYLTRISVKPPVS